MHARLRTPSVPWGRIWLRFVHQHPEWEYNSNTGSRHRFDETKPDSEYMKGSCYSGGLSNPLAHGGRLRGQPPTIVAVGLPRLSASKVSQKPPRLAQQLPKPLPLVTSFRCVEPVFECVLIAFWRTRARRTAVHAAAPLARNRWRLARTARPRFRTAARARQHRAGIAHMSTHFFFDALRSRGTTVRSGSSTIGIGSSSE